MATAPGPTFAPHRRKELPPINNAAAITAVNRALAHYRRRQAHAPSDHSVREIAQMSMLAEYLHETHTPDTQHKSEAQPASVFASNIIAAAA